jgi:hypothetical protein
VVAERVEEDAGGDDRGKSNDGDHRSGLP